MRILVTGGRGFIGTHLRTQLVQDGHQVQPFDIVDGRDLRNPRALETAIGQFRPDMVVHLAARVGRLFGEDDLLRTVEDNAGMTAIVAKACGKHDIRLAYASTSEVYGDNGNELCDELDGPFSLPHNLYGLSKKWGEDVCRLYAPDGLLIWRLSMPFGPGLPAGRGRAAIINFLYNAYHGLPLTVHRDSERSWCWVGDTVRGLSMTLDSEGVFNVGRDDNPTSMMNVALLACELCKAGPSLIKVVDPPARQTVVKRLGTQRLRDLGWVPEVELEEGMVRTLDWVMGLAAPVSLAA